MFYIVFTVLGDFIKVTFDFRKIMKIFDYNVHLAKNTDKEQKMNYLELENAFQDNLSTYKNSFYGCNFMLFNSQLSLEDLTSFNQLVKDEFEKVTLTLLYDFRERRSLEDLKEAGIKFIQFHSYVQKISKDEIKLIGKIAQEASDLGLSIMIDTSYASLDLYRYDNLKLATEVAKRVKKTPIILLQSGGARCIEAMLIAMSRDNIYLETSSSLPFYMNSTIEKDLSFVYKNLKGRVVYGSNFPYVEFDESIAKHQLFFQRNEFSRSMRDDIFYSTVGT